MGKIYYTYVLSCVDKKHYIGFSANLEQRLVAHRAGKVPATRNRLPIKLVYYEASIDRGKALTREKYFKSGFGRRFLKSRI